ncbi:diaminopimelate decarboxylase [Halothece sp. PCC 7418]|uniref:diaminopimelate decarboxylase family protein n=1 Tax=Halothece sp. (strain PCC 7418) TaxID=65093 RepID=UPI0002A05C17|nr:hypothetical protein [Halothece sp. PCC 7418]AFZ42351.1 diaminopimelate decarboxylase [Halothece sp. PCC 7418]
MLPYSFAVAKNLLLTYGSPLYVYQRDRLQDTITQITHSIPYPKTRFQFASVTNGNINLLRIFRDNDWGLHANTPGDIYLGLKAGFSPEKIVYSGSNLDRAEIEQVLQWGVTTLNLDSLSQLELFCEVYQELSTDISPTRLGLRLNLPEITGDSRIGVQPKNFPKALEIVHRNGLKLEGIHFYRGTGTNATEAFTEVMETVIETGQLLPDWSYLDFGGGFGYPYRHGKTAFDWEAFGQVLTNKLQKHNCSIDLIIEPGRSAIAQCGTLLTTIVSEKWQDHKQILGVDTTVANLSVPSVHGGYREIISWNNNQETYLTDVCGNTTYSRDYLGRNCQLPALKRGDILGILDVGAYGYAMSSHFLHQPRPAEVLLEENHHRLIRHREDYSVLLEKQIT